MANAEISPASNWTGFSLYVYSKKASYYMDAPLSGVLRPTNTWRALSGNSPLAISVPDGSDIQVLLCTPPVVVPSCITLNSTGITYTPPGDPAVQQGIVWPAQYPTRSTSGPGQSYTASQPVFLVGQYQGYTLRTAQSGVFVIMGGNTPNYQLQPNQTYILPSTAFVRISTGNATVFSVTFCEPGAS